MAPKQTKGRNRKAKKALSTTTQETSDTHNLESTPDQNTSEATVEATVEATQLAGGSVETAVSTPVKPTRTKKAHPKKLVKPKSVAKSVDVSSETTPDAVVELSTEVQTELATMTESSEVVSQVVSQVGSGKQTRSFKVRLPGNDAFEGRFTGLTPYQAANKALSKYYRETDKPKKKIQFTIRESTRGSKRSLYTYNGQREKLKVPVEYAIKDGRTITKNFKNRLIKVKKAELAALTI